MNLTNDELRTIKKWGGTYYRIYGLNKQDQELWHKIVRQILHVEQP